MLKDELPEGAEIKLDQINILVKIPKSTSVMNITAYMLDDDNELYKVKATLGTDKVYEMYNDFTENLSAESRHMIDPESDKTYVIVKIPSDAVMVDIEASIIDANTLAFTAHQIHMDIRQIHEARKLFLENIFAGDEYDARYVITEEGRAAIEAIRSGEKTFEEVFGNHFLEEFADD